MSSRLLTFKTLSNVRAIRNISVSMASSPNIEYLKLKDGKTLAYEKLESSKSTSKTVIYIPGFQSGKDGTKVSYLRQFCLDNNFSFIRYDPSSLGQSEGSMEMVEFGDWVDNAVTVLETLGSDDNVIVGSSMGGWISLWLASQVQLAEKISGLLVIAPAVNFIRPHYLTTYSNLPAEDKERLDRGEVVYIKYDENQDLGVRKSFAEKSSQYDVNCPVTILHGVGDQSVPYMNSIQIMNKLKTEDVELVFSKAADHHFSDSNSLQILSSSLQKMIREVN